MKFLDILAGALSQEEMGSLCRQFGVTYETLPGDNKRDKAREFLGYIGRKGRMTGLAEVTVAMRPDLAEPVARLFEANDEELAWLEELAPFDGELMDSSLTWRWSSSASLRPSGSKSPPPIVQPNPYTPGVRISDKSMFFGRVAEQNQLRQLLSDRAHIAIVGGRSLGSSSLLYHMASHLDDDERVLPAYIDMKEPAHHALAGFLNAVWTQWWTRVKPGNVVPIRNLAEFVTAVRKLNTAGFKPLLFLDELEQVVWRPAVFQDGLFDACYELGREKLVGFAVTSHSSPADVMVQGGSDSRFYELFQQLDLGLLSQQAARDVLTIPLGRAGLTIPEGESEHFLQLAGPHPFYLQLAGLYLFDALTSHAYSRTVVAGHFVTAASPFWQELWDSLSPLAQAHYPQRQIRESAGMAARQMRLLGNRGLVAVDDTGFKPFSEGFAGWLKRQQAAMEAAALAVGESTPINSGQLL